MKQVAVTSPSDARTICTHLGIEIASDEQAAAVGLAFKYTIAAVEATPPKRRAGLLAALQAATAKMTGVRVEEPARSDVHRVVDSVSEESVIDGDLL